MVHQKASHVWPQHARERWGAVETVVNWRPHSPLEGKALTTGSNW